MKKKNNNNKLKKQTQKREDTEKREKIAFFDISFREQTTTMLFKEL